ncbi:hypothetical protein GQ54DRAFT_307623 [Martensiomyces pterosporus]|nr:hypothetical protein GQ54DRAFT_307623 [Martensiomyces pterosporus]
MHGALVAGSKGKRRRDEMDDGDTGGATEEPHVSEPKRRHGVVEYADSNMHMDGSFHGVLQHSASTPASDPAQLWQPEMQRAKAGGQNGRVYDGHFGQEEAVAVYAQHPRHPERADAKAALQTPTTSPPSLVSYSPASGDFKTAGTADGGYDDGYDDDGLDLDPTSEYYQINLLLNRLHHERAMRHQSSINSSNAASSGSNHRHYMRNG